MNMFNIRVLSLLVIIIVAVSGSNSRPPNIVLIVADDLV